MTESRREIEGPDGKLLVGRISGAYGIKGWVRVYSYTDPMEQIVDYSPWTLWRRGEQRQIEVVDGRRQGKGVVARLAQVEDRSAAESLTGFEIVISRNRLPEPEPGEYYWHQLEGLEVVNEQGGILGTVSHLLETGAQDVLVVEPSAGSIDDRQRLIPFVEGHVVQAVDISSGCMRVDWQADY